MVTTRAQSKKQRSPEATSPNPAEKKKGAAAVLQPLGASKFSGNIQLPSAMGQRASKPGEASAFPNSHPISVSVPPSPAGLPGQQQNFEAGPPAAAPAPAAAAAPAPPAPAAEPPHAPLCGEKLLPKPSERPALGAGDKLPDGPEPAQIDVEYLPRDQLQPLDDPAAALAACTAGLDAADWVEAVKALNTLRQLAVHHPGTCEPHLEKFLGCALKSVRNLRSSLCKTAIMAVADLYISYGDALLPLTDLGGQAKPMTSLLAQVLLKCSSNDKKFVIEEAQRTLQTMAESLTPEKFLALLTPYIELHKNPKVRGKAGGALELAVARMQPAEMAAFGMPKLLQLAGRLITDNTPEAREAAKRLVGLLSAAFADAAVQQQLDVQVPEPEPAADGEPAPAKPSKWEFYCRQNLNGSAAIAVLKVAD